VRCWRQEEGEKVNERERVDRGRSIGLRKKEKSRVLRSNKEGRGGRVVGEPASALEVE